MFALAITPVKIVHVSTYFVGRSQNGPIPLVREKKNFPAWSSRSDCFKFGLADFLESFPSQAPMRDPSYIQNLALALSIPNIFCTREVWVYRKVSPGLLSLPRLLLWMLDCKEPTCQVIIIGTTKISLAYFVRIKILSRMLQLGRARVACEKHLAKCNCMHQRYQSWCKKVDDRGVEALLASLTTYFFPLYLRLNV